MEHEAKRTLAYLCPGCGQPVVIERTEFQLAAADNRLPCPCGKSELRIALGDARAELSVPCVLCGHSHTVSCSVDSLLHTPMLAFSCGASGADCCYVGEEGPVFAALARLERTLDRPREGEEASAFLDDHVMHEVLSELRDIAARGGVSCTCGGKQWAAKVRFSAVELTCPDCGGVLRIPAALPADIDALCCRDRVTIPGRT